MDYGGEAIKRTHREGWIHSLRWGYTTPPNGLPVKLAQWTDRAPTVTDFIKVYPDFKLGCGYAYTIDFPVIVSTRRKLTPAENERRKARAKKTLELKRVQKHLPLFADQIIERDGLVWKKEAAKNLTSNPSKGI